MFALKPVGMVGAHDSESENIKFIPLLRVNFYIFGSESGIQPIEVSVRYYLELPNIPNRTVVK